MPFEKIHNAVWNDAADKAEAENKRLREALSIYARRYDENKWCWNWIETDDLNGPIHEFDWKGEEQNEPWEVAEKALAALHPQPETQGEQT
jgi:hypothetical protein